MISREIHTVLCRPKQLRKFLSIWCRGLHCRNCSSNLTTSNQRSDPHVFKLFRQEGYYSVSLSRRLSVGVNLQQVRKEKETSLESSYGGSAIAPSTGEKIKENTKSVGYSFIIVGGVVLCVVIFGGVLRELFTKKSPNSVYGEALDRCINYPDVQDKLGMPLKGYGEETRRGRRRHVSHLVYEKDGVEHLRMQFYIQGSRRKGTVNLEMKENESGNYEYRYLFIQLNDFPRDVIVIEDNR